MHTLIAMAALTPFAMPTSQGPELAPATTPASSLHWGDVDGDTLLEAVAINASGEVRLLRNRGDGHLFDDTLGAGLAELRGVASVAWADQNADGYEDCLFLLSNGDARLFRGTREGVLEEAGPELGLEAGNWTHAEWKDYDLDGRPDLWITTENGDLLIHNQVNHFESVRVGSASSMGAATLLPWPSGCARGIEDTSSPGECLEASSTPMIGMLTPLSDQWSIDPSTGAMGIQLDGEMAVHALEVGGIIRSRVGGFMFPDGTFQGTRMDQGLQGPQGFVGPTGNPGPTGSQGATGSEGSVGGIGPQGPVGPAGAQGFPGGIGPTGPTGPAGSNGLGFYGTQKLEISASSFNAADTYQGTVLRNGLAPGNVGVSRSSGMDALLAGVHLPDGAQIQAITFHGYQGTPTFFVTARLIELPHTSSSTSTLATIGSGAGNVGGYTVSANVTHTVDLANSTYFVSVTPPPPFGWNGTAVAVRSVVIDYTL